MADYRVLDIETVPDLTVWTPTPKWNLVPQGDGMGLTSDQPFPPPHAQRVVAVAWCDLYSDDSNFYHLEGVRSYCNWGETPEEMDDSERRLVLAFSEAQEDDKAQLVTWNGRGFDLPVLNMRALKHKIPWGWYYADTDYRYRFSEAGHCDLMDYLGDYGAARNAKLGDICRLIGLPGKVGEVTGGQVADVVAKGSDLANMERVKNYCAQDAVQTALLFLRSRYHKGVIDAAHHDAALDSFAADPRVGDLFPGMPWRALKVG